MIFAIILAAAIVIFAFIAYLRKPDETVLRDKRARIALVAALVILGLLAALLTLFGVGEVAGGDWSGISHLVPAALVVFLMFLVRRRPLEGGVLFSAIGAAVAVFFALTGHRGLAAAVLPMLLLGAPLLAAGILLIAAALAARRSALPPGVSS